ncbi:MAG: hypothetical protein HQM02_05935 [Magnetococcales bacterium]|nr:hypothetical protein [Magnetococcales bacterium]
MYQLIPLGIASIAGYFLGKKLFVEPKGQASSSQEVPSQSLFGGNAPSIQVLEERIQSEEAVILATEEIPLDNRFGNKLLSSEHEFARTATVSMKLERGSKLVSDFKTSLWNLLESRTLMEIGKNLGISAGSEITRRIRLKFAVDPGRFVIYRVIWKQTERRGVMDVGVGGKIVEVPYLVTYGLTHVVESIQNKADPGKNAPGTSAGHEAEWE